MKLRNDICKLISLYSSGIQQNKKETEVYCEKKSTARSEYYAAYAVGLRPRFIIVVDPGDWDDATGPGGELPSMVLYDEKEYNIYRHYQTDESTVELTIG